MTPTSPAVTARHRRRSERNQGFRVMAALGVTAMILLASASTAAASHSKGTRKIRGGTAYWAESPSSPPNDIFPFMSSQYFTTANVEQFQQLMYRPLYWMGDGSTPALNESLSLAAPPVYGPGDTVTVTLKPYKWSNGEVLDARDVIFWMNMLHAEKLNWASYIPGAFPDNVSNVVADSANQLTFTLTQGYNPQWFTDNQLSQITPFPLAWDVTSKTATPGSGQCSGASYGSLDLACDAVYTFLSGQAGSDAANPTATNTAVSGYASNPLWKIVDGPWRLASFTSSGTVTFERNPQYSGPRTGALTKFVELPFTSAAAEQLAPTEVVRSYKSLAPVERAFRTFKGPLEIRPIGHRLDQRVRAHIFICTLAYYLSWHLQHAWAELLFTDQHPPTPTDPVAKAERSTQAASKTSNKRTRQGHPCHSLETLITELGLQTRNTIRLQDSDATFDQLTQPTALQARALELIATIPKHP